MNVPLDFRRVLDQLPDAVVAIDRDGVMVYVNRRIEPLLGWQPDELVGQPLAVIQPARFREAHRAGLARAVASGRSDLAGRPIRLSALARDGREIEIELTLDLLTGEESGAFVVGSLREITEQLQLERQLGLVRYLHAITGAAATLSSRLNLQQVLDTVVRTLVSDLDGVMAAIWLYNDAAGTLELRAHAGTAPPADRLERFASVGAAAPDRIAEVARTRRPFVMTDLSGTAIDPAWAAAERVKGLAGFPLLHHDRIVGVLFHVSREALRSELVELLTTLAAIATTSITDVRLYESERAARATAERGERRARLTAQVSGVLSSSIDCETTLPQVAQRLVPELADWCIVDLVAPDGTLRRAGVGHTDSSLVALVRDLHDRYPPNPHSRHGVVRVVRTRVPEVVPDVPDEWLVAAARDADHLAGLRRLALRSYLCVPILIRGAAVGAVTLATSRADGSGRRYTDDDVPTAEDLAWRMASAIEHARLYRDAQEASRAKDEFLATLSHELRTPLTSMLGWVRLIRTGRLDAAATAPALEAVERSARAQSQLIADLLDVSRIITGKLKIDLAIVDLETVVTAVLDIVTPTAQAKGVRLHRTVDPAAATVFGDAQRLQQVVWNLLTNAVKFTPRGGVIHVTLRCDDDDAELSVTDSGIGMGPALLPHVFERFRQGDSSSTRPHGGLGLGLAIVRHLVEAHGGRVTAFSEGAGRGATFVVRLPRAVHSTAPEREPPPPGVRPSLAGVRVLAVDDEADTRELLQTALTSYGADVRTVGSAQEAFETVQEWRPSILLADIGMPMEDGYELIGRVRQLPDDRGGRTPAIAVTAYARREDRERALAAGFERHLAKPVEPDELAAVVVAVLAGHGSSETPG